VSMPSVGRCSENQSLAWDGGNFFRGSGAQRQQRLVEAADVGVEQAQRDQIDAVADGRDAAPNPEQRKRPVRKRGEQAQCRNLLRVNGRIRGRIGASAGAVRPAASILAARHIHRQKSARAFSLSRPRGIHALLPGRRDAPPLRCADRATGHEQRPVIGAVRGHTMQHDDVVCQRREAGQLIGCQRVGLRPIYDPWFSHLGIGL
jgi:hypothetical protein